MEIKSEIKLEIKSVFDKEFKPYGKVVEGIDVKPVLDALKQTPLPKDVVYVAGEPLLENTVALQIFKDNLYGGMPVQLGYCNGHNTKLNCLEYHKDSEYNLGTADFILLLALESEIENNQLDTAKVKAFKAPAGCLVEVYATALHYAPCQAKTDEGFRVLVALPAGTNVGKPEITAYSEEDKLLWATNKWLIAHPDSSEAKSGAFVGLTGVNIDIVSLIQ